MPSGAYTSPERVVRDGRLVAFEGETMTMDEAASRGLDVPARGAEPARAETAPNATARRKGARK